jgi:peptidoglycan hydrolase-like protein with peptidoglycan-binding domain
MPKPANPIRALVLAVCAYSLVLVPIAPAATTGGAAAPGSPTTAATTTAAAKPAPGTTAAPASTTTATKPAPGTTAAPASTTTATKPAPGTTAAPTAAPTSKTTAATKPATTTAKPGTTAAYSKAAAAKPALAPVLSAAKCLTACAGALTVHAGGILVLHGQHFAAGTVVVFPREPLDGRKGLMVGAVMRSSPNGFVVTVPTSAHTGRIALRGPSGLRSRPYGPVSVLPPIPVALPSAVVPSGSPFDGNGMWIWYMSKADAGSVPAIAAQAKAAGMTTVFVKSSDGSTNYWPQFTSALVSAFHAQGLRVCAWQYVYGTHPVGEAQLGAEAVADGADCLVIDAETEYAGRYAAAQTYIQTLRAAVGPNYPIGLASLPYVDLHESIPYSVFLGPGGAQYNLPQIYWYTIGTSADAAFAHTYHENRIYARPIVPLGETYGGTPPAEMTRFRELAAAYGAAGESWWDWQDTTTAGWTVLDQPLGPPATPITVDLSLPLFSQGAVGDQIVWMQEHLAAAEPQTPTTGIFDAATTAALEAFQTARGIPPSGTTDVATWAALLQLTPVAVDWTTAAAPG